MNHKLIVISMLILIACMGNITASESACTNDGCGAALPYFNNRSQGLDGARNLVGLANDYHIHRYQECDFYHNFNLTFEYTKTFKPEQIAQCLFGNSLTSKCDQSIIKISGSRIVNRGTTDWLAEYFLLPRDWESTIKLEPSVSNFIIDLNWWFGLNNIAEGLYARLYTPLVHTRWTLGATEHISNVGTRPYTAGYFAPGEVPLSCLNQDGALAFLSGNVSLDNVRPLECAKWAICDGCSDSLKKTGFAEVRAALGYDLLLCEDYHLGFGIRAAAPTGTRPDGEYFFEPIVGNGHHWELGAGMTAHVTLWFDEEYDRSFAIWFDADVTHLFKTRQRRAFDLCNSPASRWMLAMGMQENNALLAGNPQFPSPIIPSEGFTRPDYVFDGTFTSVANLTCAQIDVTSGAQGELTILLDYTGCGWSFDAGYNLWGRTCAKYSNICMPKCQEGSKWALKGDSYVYGQPFPEGSDALSFGLLALTGPTGMPGPTGITSASCNIMTRSVEEMRTMPIPGITRAICPDAFPDDNTIIPLSATQSQATIFTGRNISSCTETLPSKTNPHVDNAQWAYVGPDGGPWQSLRVPEDIECPVQTSVQPITFCPIDFCDPGCCDTGTDDNNINFVRSRGLTHKFFTNFSYTWDGNECVTPFLGVGGKVELAQDTKTCPVTETCPPIQTVCPTNTCNEKTSGPCKRCALSEWGIWIKGGATFN